jgi:hypothetical protein
MSPRFEVELDRAQYAPGDTIRGAVSILESGGSRSHQVRLEYREATADYSAVATTISEATLSTRDLMAGTAFDFELRLPPDAFPNYRSEHGELYWELDVKSDELGPDTHERRRVAVTQPG